MEVWLRENNTDGACVDPTCFLWRVTKQNSASLCVGTKMGSEATALRNTSHERNEPVPLLNVLTELMDVRHIPESQRPAACGSL